MSGIRQKSSVAAFSLWSLVKYNGWLKRSENNMKDIIGISIAYWHIHIRWEVWNKTRKIRFSVKRRFLAMLFPNSANLLK